MKSTLSGLAGLNSFRNIQSTNHSSHEHQILSDDVQVSPSEILQNFPGYVSTLDRKGVWTPQSPGKCEFFKSIDSRNIVQWVNEIVHVQDRVDVLKAISDCRAENQEFYADFRLLNAHSDPKIPEWVEFKCVPLSANNTILTILHDISERKRFEKRYVEASELADQSNTAKSRFLANMSHELRTPLNAIIGFSDILKSGMVSIDDTQKQLEYQGLINDSAHHLLKVMNDILDVSKIEAGKYEIFPEEMDMAQLIQSTCQMVQPLAHKADVKLVMRFPDEPILMEADSTAIRQIIINLVSNSIKFADAHTDIDLGARRIGRKIELTITDRGPGISKEHLAELGNPFVQIDNRKSRQHEGTGLGLCIVKGLVELHEGEVEIESSLGVGTTVRILLAQSLSTNMPVPADDFDTIIRIRPQPAQNNKIDISKSRLAG